MMFSINNLRKWIKATAFVSAAVLSTSANAGLMGESVEGALGGDGQTITTQFTSPAIVGAGTEFSGVLTDGFDQVWSVSVDIADDFFTVSISESTRAGNGNVSGPVDLMTISLWDLMSVSNVVLASYDCSPAGFACSTFGGGPDNSALNFTATSIDLSFDTLRDGETYTFDITQDVPAPMSILLMLAAVGGLAASRRK